MSGEAAHGASRGGIELVVAAGSSRLKRVEFTADVPPCESVVGAALGIDWRVVAPGVANRHLTIFWDGERLWVSDRGDTGGTFLDDAPVENEWREIPVGARLLFGQAMLVARALVPDAEPATVNEPLDESVFDEVPTRAIELPPAPDPLPSPPRAEVTRLEPPPSAPEPPRLAAAPSTAPAGPDPTVIVSKDLQLEGLLLAGGGARPSSLPAASTAAVVGSVPAPRADNRVVRTLAPNALVASSSGEPAPHDFPTSPGPANAPPSIPPAPNPSALANHNAPGAQTAGDSLTATFGELPPVRSSVVVTKPIRLPRRTLLLLLSTLFAASGLAVLFVYDPSPRPTAPAPPPAVVTQPARAAAGPPPRHYTDPVPGPPAGPFGTLLGATQPAPAESASPSPRGAPREPAPLTPEAEAVEAVVQSRYDTAIARYEALAAQHPETSVYHQIAIVLRRVKEAQQQPCAPGTPAPCAASSPPSR